MVALCILGVEGKIYLGDEKKMPKGIVGHNFEKRQRSSYMMHLKLCAHFIQENQCLCCQSHGETRS